MAKRILIIEDDEDVAQVIAEVLESEGFRAMTASNGRQALEHLRNGNHPDLILLDLMMPVMDGWGFRREQKATAELAGIPVVVLTADGNARKKAQALEAAGHLAKPVSIDKLVGEVERVCGRS